MGSESLGWDVMYVAAEMWPEILLMMVKMLHSAQRLCILFFFFWRGKQISQVFLDAVNFRGE